MWQVLREHRQTPARRAQHPSLAAQTVQRVSGFHILPDKGAPLPSSHSDVAELSSEHKASVFTIPAHLGLFTRLIWNNKPIRTLLAPASLQSRPVFEDVFKFQAYIQQTPQASSWPASTEAGGPPWDVQGLLVARPSHTDIQGQQGDSSLHLVFVIPCQSLIINIIPEWATEATGEEGVLF